MREYMRLVEAGEREPWKHFEVYLPSFSMWVSMGSRQWFSMEPYKFRLKQRTININGFEVPEPASDALNIGDKYFTADPVIPTYHREYVWWGDSADMEFLKRGIVHLTKEAAIQHAKALLSFTEVKNDD